MFGFEGIEIELRRHLLAAKESINKMRLDDKSRSGFWQSPVADERGSRSSTSAAVKESHAECCKFGPSQKVSGGDEARSENSFPALSDLKFSSRPYSLKEVDSELLLSGVATFLGRCSLLSDSVVVGISTNNSWWDKHCAEAGKIEKFMKLLCYYEKVASREFFSQETFVIDAFDGQLHVLDIVLKVLSALNVDMPNAVDSVFILSDMPHLHENLNSGLEFQVNTMTDFSDLHKVVDASHLPKEFRGECPDLHKDWVDWRKRLESFEDLCCSVTSILLRVTEGLVQNSAPPWSVKEAEDLLEMHERLVQYPLMDESFVQLKAVGSLLFGHPKCSTLAFKKNQHFSAVSGNLANFYSFLVDAYLQAMLLAKDKRSKLIGSLKLRELEDQAKKNIEKLHFQEDELCKRFSEALAVGLPEVELCQLEIPLQVEIGIGQTILQEARTLLESGDCGTCVALGDIIKVLEARISSLQEHLLGFQKKLDLMRECYKVLEKFDEWFADATHFLSSLDSKERVMSPEEVKMSLEAYLHEHPQISFDVVINQCRTMHDEVLQQKCIEAQRKAMRMVNIFKIKQNRMNRELLGMQRYHFPLKNGAPPCVHLNTSNRLNGALNAAEDFRRRSYAGQTSIPVYGPWRHSLTGIEQDAELQAYVEQLFQEGLITENMSERIVASLPKGLSDSTMRGSRESLRSSRESLRESNDSLVAMAMSFESLPTSSQVNQTQMDGTATISRCGTPHWKLFQKARCLWTDRIPLEKSRVFPSRAQGMQAGNHSVSCQSLNQNQSPSFCLQSGAATSSNPFSAFSFPSVGPAICGDNHSQLSMSEATKLAPTARDRNLALIMEEMINTEHSYINSLKFIIANYIPELARGDLAAALRGKKSMIFGNLEKIYQFHSRSFVGELEEIAANPLSIGNVFLHHGKEFYMYALYSKNKPTSDILMTECGTSFFKRKQLELGDRMDLSSYLLKPIQRMTKYALLLEQILKESDAKDPNYTCLKDALEMVRFELRHGNDLLAMDCIRNCDVNLQEQGMLLRQEEFLVWQGSRKRLRRIFLFEDLILFSKAKRHSSTNEQYVYKNGFKMCEIGITENVATNEKLQFEIWFRKRAPKFTFILQATSVEIRQAWINEIARILWKQAVRSRKQNLNNVQRMGIGWKETTDLEQSGNYKTQANYINSNTVSDPWVPLSRPVTAIPNKTQVFSIHHQNNNRSATNSDLWMESTESNNKEPGTTVRHGEPGSKEMKAKLSTRTVILETAEPRDPASTLPRYSHLVSTDV